MENKKSKEWFCNKCYCVFYSVSGICSCGSENTEIFDIQKHGRNLIGGSNAWKSVWNRWKTDKMLNDIAFEKAEYGCYGAHHILNSFINRLITENAILKSEIQEYRNQNK